MILPEPRSLALAPLGLMVGVASPADTARDMTAVVTGLVPLIPVPGWQGIAPDWVRAVAGLVPPQPGRRRLVAGFGATPAAGAAACSPLTGEVLVVVWVGFAALLVAPASRSTALLLLVLLAAPLATWAGCRNLGTRQLAVLGTVVLAVLTRIVGRWTRADETPIEHRLARWDESGGEGPRRRSANAGI